ncbi:MAG: BolA family protein [Pseudomonadota bacterium]
MSISKEIEDIIQEKFAPEHFELVNQSHLHEGHAGHDGSGESHFKLMVVSSVFESHNRVQRHRLVNSVLNDLFSRGLHALSVKAFTPAEYNSKK